MTTRDVKHKLEEELGTLLKEIPGYSTISVEVNIVNGKLGKTYNYSYTCSISAKPNNVKLFLTGEGSYFDSENVPTAMKAVRLGDKTDNQVYNIRGQRTDKSHQGVVVTHGKKVLVK